MDTIRIITDSASDIREPYRDDMTVLPIRITFGETEYLDGVTIDHRLFYEKLIECDSLPVTSLISPAVFEDVYQKAVDAGEKVIVLPISSKMSGTYQSALLAAERFQGSVFVVDTLNVTIGQRILIEYALQLIDSGMPAAEIAATLEKMRDRIHILALLDTLEYLKKGGRISKSAALVGSALSIKPVVTVTDGEVVMLGKARGSRNGSNFLIKEIENTDGVDFTKPFYLGYTGLSDALLQKYIADSQQLWKEHTAALPICTIGATVGTHVGPNAIAVAFFDKNEP